MKDLLMQVQTQSGLRDVLLLLASGGLGYWPVYAFIERLASSATQYGEVWRALVPGTKRLVVLVFCIALALIGWALLMVLGYATTPVTQIDWAEQLFDVVWKTGSAAFAASTIRHGYDQGATAPPVESGSVSER